MSQFGNYKPIWARLKELHTIHAAAKQYCKANVLKMCLCELSPSEEIEYTNALRTKRASKKEIFKLINQL